MNDEFMEQIDQDLRDEGRALKAKEASNNVRGVLEEVNISEDIIQKVIDAINVPERSK